MEISEAQIKSSAKAFILSEFLEGEDPDALDDTTPLITSGVLDSIATVRLVSFLEETFGIELEAHEMSADQLNTLPQIASLVRAKRRTA